MAKKLVFWNIQEPTLQTINSRQREENGSSLSIPQACPQWHMSSNKATPPNPSQTVNIWVYGGRSPSNRLLHSVADKTEWKPSNLLGRPWDVIPGANSFSLLLRPYLGIPPVPISWSVFLVSSVSNMVSLRILSYLKSSVLSQEFGDVLSSYTKLSLALKVTHCYPGA